MTVTASPRTLREERLVRRMVGRGEAGLAESLCALKGVTFGRRFVFRSLYAIGGEGAVYDVEDLVDPSGAPLVAKVALHPVHRPFELTVDGIRVRRLALRRESVMLATCGSVWMPEDVGHYQFVNPALDAHRGGVYAEAEPVLLMEKLPGIDLDRWLARVHRRGLPPAILKRTLDRYCVALLQSVADLTDRGFHYADLRPGNVRVIPQPVRRIRLLDAGSIVRDEEREEFFPHVPAYLPPDLYRRAEAGERIVVSVPVTAVMAGRSLYEIAVGEPPFPGEVVDASRLAAAPVSPPVRDIILALSEGEVGSVKAAVESLTARAVKRVARPEHSAKQRMLAAAAASAPAPTTNEGEWQPAAFLNQGDVALPPAAAAPRAMQAAPATSPTASRPVSRAVPAPRARPRLIDRLRKLVADLWSRAKRR